MKRILVHICVLGLCLASPALYAKVSAQKAAQLGGKKYTCMGALRAGSKDGAAEYTGKWFKKWPGVTKEQGYEPSPYDNEQPLFTITASNYQKYADKLTQGEIALLKKYPNEFKMNIYKSHRDFRVPPYVCKDIKKNALNATLIKNGLDIKDGAGAAPPFPFPKNGLQAIWNVINAVGPWTEESTYDTADTNSNGSRSWGRTYFKDMNPTNAPNPSDRSSYSAKARAYFLDKTILPPGDANKVAVGFQYNDFSEGNTQAWQYLPGIRRVREAPEVGFDYPVPPAGLRTTDSDYCFNGSPKMYNWKLLGKKEIYIPWNNFKINDPSLSYSQILDQHVLNPKYVRFELHRVWVIQATIKKGVRQIFSKRVFYVDPDTWLAATADNYDNHGELYRVPMIMYHYSQASGTYHRGVSAYYTLTSGAWEATYLVNERNNGWWKINTPMHRQDFTPEAAARAGQ